MSPVRKGLAYRYEPASPAEAEAVLNDQLRAIGQKLIELRQKMGYTSYETFAFDFGIPRGHYWRVEAGKTNLTMASLMTILRIHGLTMVEFFSTLTANDGP